jgi:nitroreductase
MVLTAVNEALGTCCVGSFNDADVKMVLNIPNNFEVLVMIAVGYPKEKVDISTKLLRMVRKRKNLSEVVSEEEFGKPFLTQRNTQP